MLNLIRFVRLLSLTLSLSLSVNAVLAQGTALTYQGKLTDSGNPASGQYDFQFKLFDTQTVGTGTQKGSPVVVSNVTVASGIFTVQLDFGACPTCFDGSTRFLEIAAKQTGDTTFTTLGPRQPVSSNPYAIRSLNAATADGLSGACVNCVTGSQIASVNGSAVTGTIPVASVPAGSTNYVQNGTAPQSPTNFNISGDGTAGGTLSGNVVNAATQFNIGGNRVLSSAGSSNFFAGVSSGANNTSGSANSFFGNAAGAGNTTGFHNAFFGTLAGNFNTIGNDNSFFGFQTGVFNTTGVSNSFFGSGAGGNNTSGNFNSFFGGGAGFGNTTGMDNSFFGHSAGVANTASGNSFFGSSAGFHNTSGGANSFFGTSAGNANTTGSNNSFFGSSAGSSNTTASGNSFFGMNSGASNTAGAGNSFFGHSAGASNTTGSSNSFFGEQAGQSNTTGAHNAFFGLAAGFGNTTGAANAFFGFQAGSLNSTGFSNAFFGAAAGIQNTTASGNSFFGANAGAGNTSGISNSFFGESAGASNTTADQNSFFGQGAGEANSTGFQNSFFGQAAGIRNTTGGSNAFFGIQSGVFNTTGNDNTFVGKFAGDSNTTENRNTFLGSSADGAAGIANSTAIGANASVTQSNSLVLGSINGINGANADTSVGIGIRAPTFKLQVVDSSNTGLRVQTNAAGGTVASFGGNGDFQVDSSGTVGGRFIATESGNVGIGTATPNDKLEVNGIIRVQALGVIGFQTLCRNGSNQISTCSSSLRYKTDVHPYLGGLKIAMQLRPITFAWKDGGKQDVGFGAEDVATIEPRLTFKNEKGEIEGVNYGQITTVLVNSIKELQARIENQQKQMDALRNLICLRRRPLKHGRQQLFFLRQVSRTPHLRKPPVVHRLFRGHL